MPLELLLDTAIQKLAVAAHHHQDRLSDDDILYLKHCKHQLDIRSSGKQPHGVEGHGEHSASQVVATLRPEVNLEELRDHSEELIEPLLATWKVRIEKVTTGPFAEPDTYVGRFIDHVVSCART